MGCQWSAVDCFDADCARILSILWHLVLCTIARDHLIRRIQFPFLVWISSILGDPVVNLWRPELLKQISLFSVLDLTMVFLAFFIINMVSLQGKSTYFSGLCLVAAYLVYLLINYYE